MSSFSETIPGLLSSSPAVEPVSFADYSVKVGRKIAMYENQRAKRVSTGSGPTADKLAILATNTGFDGQPSDEDAQEHEMAANRIAKLFTSIGLTEVELIPSATADHLFTALDDPRVSDIMFIGHSDRGSLILDRTASWTHIADTANILKDSFGVLGCSETYKEVVVPRAGQFAVKPDGLLYGTVSGTVLPWQMHDLGHYQPLETQIPGRPS